MLSETVGQNEEITAQIDGRVFVAIFNGKIEGAMVSKYRMLQAAMAQQAGEHIVGLTIVRNGSPDISEDVRLAATRLMDSAKDYTDASAIVISVDGMLGTIIRSVITGIMLLARTPYPCRIFQSTSEAVDWLSKESQLSPDECASLLRMSLA